MKSGDLARLFGVSSESIRQWTESFKQYLSDSAQAKSSRQRTYNDDDVLVLATVAKYSAEGYSRTHIKEKLSAGERVEHPGVANFGIDSRMVPTAAVEQMIDATEIKIALEQVKAERDKLLDMLQQERDQAQKRETEFRGDIKDMQEKIMGLQRELGRAEGRLEEIERGREEQKKTTNNDETPKTQP